MLPRPPNTGRLPGGAYLDVNCGRVQFWQRPPSVKRESVARSTTNLLDPAAVHSGGTERPSAPRPVRRLSAYRSDQDVELRGLLRRERWRGGDQPGHMLIHCPVIPLSGAQRVTATAAATQIGCSQGARLPGRPGSNTAAPAVSPAASTAHSAPAPSCVAHGASRPLCGTASSPPGQLAPRRHPHRHGHGHGHQRSGRRSAPCSAWRGVVWGGEMSSDPALSAYAESVGHDDEPWTWVPGRSADGTESSLPLSAGPAA